MNKHEFIRHIKEADGTTTEWVSRERYEELLFTGMSDLKAVREMMEAQQIRDERRELEDRWKRSGLRPCAKCGNEPGAYGFSDSSTVESVSDLCLNCFKAWNCQRINRKEANDQH